MNIWNKVFLALAFILAAVIVYFALQERVIRDTWEKAITRLETKIQDSEKERQIAITGTAPDKATEEKSFEELSLDELLLNLQELVFERNKAWFHCQAGSIEETTIDPEQLDVDDAVETPSDRLKPVKLFEVRLKVTEPVVLRGEKEEVLPPTDMKGVVYLIDNGRDGAPGTFLGRFRVTQIRGTDVTLLSVDELNEEEEKQLNDSARQNRRNEQGSNNWAVYSVIPMDRQAGVFDKLYPEEFEAVVPARMRDRMINPDRPLKDFDVLLDRLYAWRTNLQQLISRSKTDIARNEDSLAKAADETQSLQGDKELENKRIAAMKRQVENLEQKVKEYDARIEDLLDKIALQQKQNEWYVARIAEYQLKVAQLIRDRADTAARNSDTSPR